MTTKLIRAGLAFAALLALPMAAQAADLPAPSYKAPAYVAPSYPTWSGFYVGINGGYGFGNSDWDVPAVNTGPKGFLVGGTVGYNLQTGAWVWGIEGDFDYSAMKGTEPCAGPDCETRLSWLATARGRIGYGGWGSLLPYITGGAAFGNVKATRFGDASETRIGWTVGGGLEYALFSNWSVKAEYLYVDLGKFDCGPTCGAPVDNVSFTSHVVRAGVNYRF
jgi:outer membrane immunogenic protein